MNETGIRSERREEGLQLSIGVIGENVTSSSSIKLMVETLTACRP